MPAAGKSTIGVLLAKALGYDFLDTDLLIQVTTQRTLPQIIAEDGFLGLRKIEADVIGSVDCDRTIIATGGSAVYAPESMAHLSSLGRMSTCGQTQIFCKNVSVIWYLAEFRPPPMRLLSP